jgi:glycosyltransferase involved in cell wall biosynthesis
LQRTLSFSIHLREHGWRPIVLTVDPILYERAHPQQLADIPPDVIVERTRAFDAARRFSIRGHYWSRLAQPDRWASWCLSAVPHGLRLIYRHRVDAIWSTYPLATAHLIGATLARLTRLPWIADFRDPMVEFIARTGEYYPIDPVLRRARLAIVARAARGAAHLVFCTAAACRIVKERYPGLNANKLSVISNGYEEQSFIDAESLVPPPAQRERSVLLHSGTVYPGADRDPTALFVALRQLLQQRHIGPRNFELRLRDPSNADHFRQLASIHDISDLVTIEPPLPYREALAEMLSVEGLLLLQGEPSNPAIPAKLYEYLRAGRPIIALVHPEGETAATLRLMAIDTVAPLTDAGAIAHLLLQWVSARWQMTAKLPSRLLVSAYSRERLTSRLATTLDEVIAIPARGGTGTSS